MRNKEYLEILKKGVKVWNEWRSQNPHVVLAVMSDVMSEADLRNANLGEANLRGANLRGANLRDANLGDADLSMANLTQANLRGANLGGSNLGGADLILADLSGSNLIGANLRGANLRDANLSLANLTGADLSFANLTAVNLTAVNLKGANLGHSTMEHNVLVDVDLSVVRGLEKVNHRGPSSIGLDTIYLSRGRIPEVFLRGAGVPEPFIAEMKALVSAMEPIQFYSCFISYSSKDQEFVERLYADLQHNKVRCWFAPEDMKIGDSIRPRIDEAIRIHDKLLLVLTARSVESEWVEKEVETAFEKERKQRRAVLFPIRLDDAVMETEEAWAADIRRTRHIGDFREWKHHDSYQKAFARLLRDLETGDQS